MGKNAKPSENKVKVPSNGKLKGGKTKHRKGGEKARKLGPSRRLARAMDRFTSVSEELTVHKRLEENEIKVQVGLGIIEPMAGWEFHDRINRPRHKTINAKKIARLLMPNSF